MSRRVYLLGVALTLVALAFLLTDALLWQPGPTEANAKRIRPGMSLQEVEAILGDPGDRIFIVRNPFPGGKGAPPPNLIWMYDEGDACLYIDRDGRVEHFKWSPSGRTRPDPFSRLRAWLGW